MNADALKRIALFLAAAEAEAESNGVRLEQSYGQVYVIDEETGQSIPINVSTWETY